MKKVSHILPALLLIASMMLSSCGAAPAEDQAVPADPTQAEDTPAEEQAPAAEETQDKPAKPEPKQKSTRKLTAEQEAERERRAAMPVPEASDYVFDEENIILSFGAFADTHTRRSGDEDDFTNQNFSTALDFLLEYTNNDLDAICVSGDVTDSGVFNQVKGFTAVANEKLSEKKLPILFSTGNHDLYNLGMSNFMKQYLYTGAFSADLEITDGDPYCRHSKVKGVHFIQISADAYEAGSDSYTEDSLTWLQKRLAAAAKDAPNMPIFVSTHLPVYDTVFGSDTYSAAQPTLTWASTQLKAILAEYPQAVLLTGHTHYPQHAESAIVQDDFTMINVGTTNYIVVDPYFSNATTTPEGYMDHPQSMLIEVDKHGGVRITRFDYAEKAQIRDLWILPPANHEDFLSVYTYGRGNAAPVFSVKDAAVKAVGEGTARELQLTFTAADADSAQIYYYEVEIHPAGSTKVKTLRFLTDFYLALQPEDMATDLSYYLGKVSIGTSYEIILTPYTTFYTAGESQTITVDLT